MDSDDEMILTQNTFKDSSSGEDTDGVISQILDTQPNLNGNFKASAHSFKRLLHGF